MQQDMQVTTSVSKDNLKPCDFKNKNKKNNNNNNNNTNFVAKNYKLKPPKTQKVC